MDLILEGILKAFHLLITLDPEVFGITLLSLQISERLPLSVFSLESPSEPWWPLRNFRGEDWWLA